MTNMNYLTVSELIPLPWHNLNRDDRGLPKSLREGGAQRGMLSPQSRKRAARLRFEEGLDDASIRSRQFPKEAAELAGKLAAERGVAFDEEAARKQAEAVVNRFTSTAAKSDSTGETTITWLSGEEFGALVDALAASGGTAADIDTTTDRTTSSLAIAGFGRMMAADQRANVDAAVAVGPAVTTHPITIEIDYFTAVDDVRMRHRESTGSGHLGQSYYTSGVYYSSFTLDRAQLKRNWTGWDAPGAEERLRRFVEALIVALPSGKQTNTAAKSLPAFILAEEQAHRFTYEFHKPVAADEEGGFLAPSITRLVGDAARARDFDRDSIGATFVSGAGAEIPDMPFAAERGDLGALVDFIVMWLRDA